MSQPLRFAILCVIFLLACPPARSQSPDIAALARRSLELAFPQLSAAAPTVTPLSAIDTTALGCERVAGLPLPAPIDVYRLGFMLAGDRVAVHVSADGSLIQPCDSRYPNLGAGAQPVARPRLDSDGDGLGADRDACPWIAGQPTAARAGCPLPSDADRDGDGSPDGRDRCPEQAGAAAAHGCALLRDEDGDGVPDHVDICPADRGLIRGDFALGCPADGSGSSSLRRESAELCLAAGDAPIYAERATDVEIIGALGALAGEEARAIIGRTAANDWLQLTSGWVERAGLRLSGACFNIPLVNAEIGGATGCFMRARDDFANVRQAPGGKQVARLSANRTVALLGRDVSGDWLFYRRGWASGAVVELSGSCDDLPVLDPAKVASGTVHFCPPEYAGLLRPRIDIGEGKARIASETLANRLRAAPNVAAEQIGELPPRAVLDAVLDGPACDGRFIWWQVALGDLIGWTVESDVRANYYYLEPVAAPVSGLGERDRSNRAPAHDERPWTEELIHSANTSRLDTVKLLAVDAPESLAWSPRGAELALVTAGGQAKRYRYPDFALIEGDALPPESGLAQAIAYDPAGRVLAVGRRDGAVNLVDLTGDRPGAVVGKLDPPVHALVFSPQGDKLAAISGDESRAIDRRAGSLKLWALDDASAAESALMLHFSFPYPLTSLAFNADGTLLAVAGESTKARRAGMWIYRVADGALAHSQALIPMGGAAYVLPAPDAALGDFVYNSGDSLYQLAVESGESTRIYHQAGLALPAFAFRRQVMPDAEALLAVSSIARTGAKRLRLVNALNAYSPALSLDLAAAAFAFSPDGRALAVVDGTADRLLILGVTTE